MKRLLLAFALTTAVAAFPHPAQAQDSCDAPDSFGYGCLVVPSSYIEARTVLLLSGDDASTEVTLPFPFSFYGQAYHNAFVSTNGFINFLGHNSSFSNVPLPSTNPPNAAIYAFWDDLAVDSLSSVRTELLGTAPFRRFVIEWRNVRFFGDTTRRIDLEAVLYEDGRILLQYGNIADDGREMGNSATVGIENEAGTVALQYSHNQSAILPPEFALLFTLDSDADGIPDDRDVEEAQEAVADLPQSAFAPTVSAGGHRTAMINRLEDIEALIASGDIEQAIERLRDLRRKVDGCPAAVGTTPHPDDWVVDCAAQLEIRSRIDDLIAALET